MASTPASVSALLKPRANIGRNAFPLDHRQVFSIKAGQITPVKALKFVPNDHFSIDVSEFGITMPMNTAPFLRGRKETVFYSVYNSAVWSLFNQYIAQRSDPKTSSLNTNLHEPRIALWELYKGCIAQFYYYVYQRYIIRAQVRIAHVAEDIIDWSAYDSAAENSFLDMLWGSNEVFNFSDFQILTISAPQFSNVDFTLPYGSPAFAGNPSPTNRQFCQDIVGQYRAFSWVRKLDMLGYGNLTGFFNEFIRLAESRFANTDWSAEQAFTIFRQSLQNAFSTYVLIPSILSSILFDSYGSDDLPTANSNVTYDYKNLYPICGYNLIFYHFFRNSFYDLNYYTRDYNLDFISVYNNDVPNTSLNIVKLADFSLRFLDIEYHQWKKDTFTGVLPDTQFGAVSSISLNIDTNIPVVGESGFSVSNPFSTIAQDSIYSTVPSRVYGVDANGNTSPFSALGRSSSSFDVITFKRAEILQDYRQTLMRAGNKTSDVFKALYGGAPSSEHEDDIIPRFLDTFGTDIFIDPVTATANTEQGNNGTLGDLSARGKFSGRSGHIKFNSGNNFGVLFCLTYFVPTAEYNSYFIDPANNCLNPEDHYISNFENMGLEPVYSDELNNLKSRKDLTVLGYAPRYHYLKSQVDVVHGEFISQTSAPFRTSNVNYQGAFNIWVAPRTEMQNRNNTMVRDFYVNPSVLDNIFVNQVDATQASDHVICNYYLNIKATRGMSKVGLLNFV